MSGTLERAVSAALSTKSKCGAVQSLFLFVIISVNQRLSKVFEFMSCSQIIKPKDAQCGLESVSVVFFYCLLNMF